jgi:hypothetical protein
VVHAKTGVPITTLYSWREQVRVDPEWRPSAEHLALARQTDPNHISLVARITFSDDILKLMFLTTTVPNFTDPSIAELAFDIMVCRTAKGYQTLELMSVYLPDVLAHPR